MRWMAIYALDSVICPLTNWTCCLVTFLDDPYEYSKVYFVKELVSLHSNPVKEAYFIYLFYYYYLF